MQLERRLSDLAVGEGARVAQIEAAPTMRRRLMDLGLIPGTQVTCVAKSPAGDPAAYQIRGAVIALRGGDTAGICLEDGAICPVPLYRAALSGWD